MSRKALYKCNKLLIIIIIIKLFVFRQQLYIHLALHLLCLLISSRQCRSHRRLDFFYSNTNNFVQLEDTAIKTERCCSMQCTERTRAMHHIIDFYLYFKSNIVFGVIIDNQISPRGINFLNITW